MALASRLTAGQRLAASGRACPRTIPGCTRPVQHARSSSAATQQLGTPCDRAGSCRRARLAARATPEAAAAGADTAAEEFAILDVEELRGIRVNLDNQEPVVEYRVQWKDGSPDTWELASNVSPDLVRDFDERWWAGAKKGDSEVLSSMLQYSRAFLSQVVDDNRRSALHFAAAIGNVKCIKLLVDAGADLNLQDKEGYTPLHMAAGYMQTAAMLALLEAGADPRLKDKTGRDVMLLVDNLRRSMPPSMNVLQRIMALEQVASGLTDRLYEEVEPAHILEERPSADGSSREFLVQFKDDVPDEWLPEACVAPDLLEDWTAGLERAPVAALLDVQQWGTSREYLVAWADGSPDSWEPEEHVPQELIAALQEQQPQLFKGLKMGKKKKRKSKAAKKQAAVQQQHDVGSMMEHGNGNGSSESGSGRPEQAASALAAAVHASSSAEQGDAAPASSRQHATVAS